jgi:hypothetical protein
MSNSKNQLNVPQAKEAMERFKMECANEVGVNLKQGYNGDISAREAGSVGGQMVKNKLPVRNKTYIRNNRNAKGHQQEVTYQVSVGF